MSIYLLIPFLALLALVQATIGPYLTFAGVKPDLMLIAVISWSLLRGVREGIGWAFIGGLWLDLLSNTPLGISTLALMVVSLACALGELNVFRNQPMLPVLTVILGTILFTLVCLFLMQILAYHVIWWDSLRRVMLPSILLNALIAPMLYLPLSGLHRLTGRRAMNW